MDQYRIENAKATTHWKWAEFNLIPSSGAPLHTLSKLYDVPVGFDPPSPILRLNIAYFAVAEGWLLLDIG